MKSWQDYSALLSQLEPVIIVGMHRSGTSLLSRIFNDLGIHMGGWLSRDAEAVFFQRINRSIYKKTGAHWAEPENLITAGRSDIFFQDQVHFVQKRLIGSRVKFGFQPLIANNFGREFWLKLADSPRTLWGWKDPRTALLIPLWHRIFPKARWIHIVRDGVDVAISLYSRALRQQKKILLKFYRFDFSERTLDFGYCFRLWEDYLSAISEGLADIDRSNVIQLKYEDLLRDPVEEIRKLLEILGYQVDKSLLEKVCQQVNPGRLDNTDAKSRYQSMIASLPESSWMETLGYQQQDG